VFTVPSKFTHRACVFVRAWVGHGWIVSGSGASVRLHVLMYVPMYVSVYVRMGAGACVCVCVYVYVCVGEGVGVCMYTIPKEHVYS
jgi:hypothetical protein